MTTRLSFILFLLALIVPVSVMAQEDEEKKLKDNYKEELKKDYVTKLSWEQDFDKAKAKAKKENKVIFAYFSRSYAPCKPCEKVQNQLLLTKEFKEFAKDKILYLGICTKIEGRKHDFLFRKLGFNSFPSIAFISEKGTVLRVPDEVPVNCTVESLTKEFKKAQKKAGIQSEEGAKVTAELKKLLEDTKKKAKEFDEQAQYDLEVYATIQKMKKLDFEDPDTFDKYSKGFYDSFKKGKKTKLFHNNFRYYDLVFRYAVKQKDLKTAEASFKDLSTAAEDAKKKFPAKKYDYAGYLRDLKKNLRALKEKVAR